MVGRRLLRVREMETQSFILLVPRYQTKMWRYLLDSDTYLWQITKDSEINKHGKAKRCEMLHKLYCAIFVLALIPLLRKFLNTLDGRIESQSTGQNVHFLHWCNYLSKATCK